MARLRISKSLWWWSFKAGLLIFLIIAFVVMHYHQSFDRSVQVYQNENGKIGYTAVIQVPDDFFALGSSMTVLTADRFTDMDIWDWFARGTFTERVVDINLNYIRLAGGEVHEEVSHTWRYSEFDGATPPDFITRVELMKDGLVLKSIWVSDGALFQKASWSDVLAERIDRRFQFRNRRFSVTMEELQQWPRTPNKTIRRHPRCPPCSWCSARRGI